MKTTTLFPTLLIASALLVTACKRESTTTMSDDDISETVSNDFSESSGGTSTDITAGARTAAVIGTSAFCGLSGDTTITATGPAGRYTLTTTWNWVVNCTGGTPSSVGLSNTGSASYDGTYLDFSNTFVGEGTMTGLGSAFTEFSASGSSVRTGSGTIVDRKRSKDFTYVNTVTYTEVKVRKADYTVASGSGSAHLTGTVVDGNAFDRTATFVFNGDGTYTLTLDNGAVYTFNLL